MPNSAALASSRVSQTLLDCGRDRWQSGRGTQVSLMQHTAGARLVNVRVRDCTLVPRRVRAKNGPILSICVSLVHDTAGARLCGLASGVMRSLRPLGWHGRLQVQAWCSTAVVTVRYSLHMALQHSGAVRKLLCWCQASCCTPTANDCRCCLCDSRASAAGAGEQAFYHMYVHTGLVMMMV